jgi:hypothetical protein
VDVSGNWEVDLEPTAANVETTPFFRLAGSLAGSASSAQVTGTLQTYSSSAIPCTDNGTVVTVTGTIDQSDNLHLSFPVAGGSAALDGQFDPDLGEVFSTIEIDGGPCGVAPTTVLIYEVPAVTGTWTGLLRSSSSDGSTTAALVTAALTQATTPSADGSYLLTGNLSSTGSCSGSFSFSNGEIEGNAMNGGSMTIPVPGSPYFLATAPVFGFSSTPVALVAFSNCSGTYTGSLTKQ